MFKLEYRQIFRCLTKDIKGLLICSQLYIGLFLHTALCKEATGHQIDVTHISGTF